MRKLAVASIYIINQMSILFNVELCIVFVEFNYAFASVNSEAILREYEYDIEHIENCNI